MLSRPHQPKLCALAISLALLACSPGAVPTTPTPAKPTSTPPPTRVASPTPIPTLLFLTESDPSPLGAALEAWARARGWAFRSARPSQDGTGTLPSTPGVSAIVGAPGALSAELAAGAPVSLPVVLVEAPGVEPGAALSTVGEPGARHDQAAFMAGVLAGLASREGSVGMIEATGGAHETVYATAFLYGLRYSCTTCALQRTAAGEVSPQTADRFRANAVDVVFAVPGPRSQSALSALAPARPWIVWVGEPPELTAEARLAGGVAFVADGLITSALEALLRGEPGRAWPYSFENGGLAVASLNPEAINPGRRRLVEEAQQGLASGRLEVGIDGDVEIER